MGLLFPQFFTRCSVFWTWKFGTSDFLLAASRNICSCVPHFVFLHCIFLAVVTGTCFHSSYMCFFYITAFVFKNNNYSQTRNNLLQIRTPEVFCLTLTVKHRYSQDVETLFLCVCVLLLSAFYGWLLAFA